MERLLIKTSDLVTPYGIKEGTEHKIVAMSESGKILYVKNPKHDPDAKPGYTSAWVAVFSSESEIIT